MINRLVRYSAYGIFILLSLNANAVDCDRACVIKKVDGYVAALMAHDPKSITFADGVRSMENGKEVKIGEGVWTSITEKGNYQQTFVDDGLTSAVHFGAFKEGGEPLLLAIRFAFKDGAIAELETMTSRFDQRNRVISRHQLTEPNPVYEMVAPKEKQLSRDKLVAAGHAYFDGIAQSTDEGVPMHPECNRRENGVLLLKNDNPTTEPCPIGFHRFNYITDVRDRRVAVVDTQRNLVLIWAFFDIPGNIEVAPGPFGPSDLPNPEGAPRVDSRRTPRSLYIAELFRIQDGTIRDIEAIMFNLDLGAKSGWE